MQSTSSGILTSTPAPHQHNANVVASPTRSSILSNAIIISITTSYLLCQVALWGVGWRAAVSSCLPNTLSAVALAAHSHGCNVHAVYTLEYTLFWHLQHHSIIDHIIASCIVQVCQAEWSYTCTSVCVVVVIQPQPLHCSPTLLDLPGKIANLPS